MANHNQTSEWSQPQNLKQLRENAVNEKNSAKQAVLLALYDHALHQKQQTVINHSNFIR